MKVIIKTKWIDRYNVSWVCPKCKNENCYYIAGSWYKCRECGFDSESLLDINWDEQPKDSKIYYPKNQPKE